MAYAHIPQWTVLDRVGLGFKPNKPAKPSPSPVAMTTIRTLRITKKGKVVTK